MVIILDEPTTKQLDQILLKINSCGFEPCYVEYSGQKLITVNGKTGACHSEEFAGLPGVGTVIPIDTAFKISSRAFKPGKSVVEVAGVRFGAEPCPVIAGPCAIEGYEQFRDAALAVKGAGAVMLRGGAYKPRTSPYSFQGLAGEGLKILQAVSREVGLPSVSEITDPRQLDMVSGYVDMLQIGTRNMQNFTLLKEVAKSDKPVLLKRGMAATVEEWLMAAEYVMAGGNAKIVLCERGIRTFSSYTRNTLDLSAVPVVQQLSHLPVIVDPSHATGDWRLVAPMARAAAAAGADGLMIEVHPCPAEAVSDGPQSLNPRKFSLLMRDLQAISAIFDRTEY